MQFWKEFKSSLVISVHINIEELSIHTVVSDRIMNTINVLSFSTLISLFNMIVSIILSQSVSKAGETFHKFTYNTYLFLMYIYDSNIYYLE